MDSIQTAIVQLLEREPMKPSLLAKKLGISRQALHRHVRVLMADKLIRKHGTGPHVLYSAVMKNATTTRVHADYVFCKEQLLPQYLDEFADFFGRFLQSSRKEKLPEGRPELGFLLDEAAVYSSNIEGNTLNLNSFLNSRMSPKKHRPKEAQEIEDLVSAYEYAREHNLTEKHLLRAHKMLSREFVAPSRQGVYRQERVGVFSQRGLEYMAVEPHFVAQEMHALFTIIQTLLREKQTPAERFFWATWTHLMIALIHPLSDGNGRAARLCEKWFLASTLGDHAFAVPSEQQYWDHRPAYYASLKLGVNYWEADMGKASAFFALLPQALLNSQQKE